MKIPQVVFIVLAAVELGISLGKHGEPKTGIAAEYNFWVALAGWAILVAVISWGGFWQ